MKFPEIEIKPINGKSVCNYSVKIDGKELPMVAGVNIKLRPGHYPLVVVKVIGEIHADLLACPAVIVEPLSKKSEVP